MNDDSFTPQSESIPEEVRQGVVQALGVPAPAFRRLHGGTTDRTFLVTNAGQQWVLRVETMPAAQLPRAVAAQRLAQSAGVAVPDIIAFEVPRAGTGYCWSLEQFLAGAAFDHAGFHTQVTQDAARDLGRQLRRLHTIAIDGRGLIPHQQLYAHRVERALEIANMPPADRVTIERAYAFIKAGWPMAARLCKNDCAGANILVQYGKVAGIIDWEWAWGGDPAWDIAYWQHHNADSAGLDFLIAGYEPDDPPELRRRVAAQQVACAIELISVFSENVQIFDQPARNGGIRMQQTRLDEYIRRQGWEL